MRAALLIPVVLLAGTSRPAAPDTPPPTFRSDTQVVLLDVVARDAKGRAVPDLRLEELQVFEDGKRCDVQSFRLVRARRSGPEAPTPETPPAAVATQSEAVDTSAPSRANLVVLLFDRLLVPQAPYARQGALALLDRPFPANTWFAVFKVSNIGTQMLQPFTANRERLRAAVLAATTGDESRGAAVAEPKPTTPTPDAAAADLQRPPDAPPLPAAPFDVISERVQTNLSGLSRRVQELDTLYGIRAIARGLGVVRGRKSILYFGVGREFPHETSYVYDATVSDANRANVTIHTVDVRGLTSARVGGRSAFDSAIGQYSASGATGGGRGAIGNESWTVATEGGDRGGGPLGDGSKELKEKGGSFLDNVARDTGGLAIRDTNDLGAGLGRVFDELGEYYELVYTPADPTTDGRFHRIAAKVTRPGVRVRTRSGYFATPASAPMLLAYELPLTAAIASAEPPQDLPHSAGLLHFEPKGRERETLFEASLSLADVRAVPDETKGVYRAHVQLLGFLRDEAGRAVARFSHDWPIEGPLAERARLSQSQVAFRRWLTLPPGRYTVETALQDVESRLIGVFRSSADVPPPQDGLALGSLWIVRHAAPAEPGAGSDELQAGGVALEPHLGLPVLDASVRQIALFLHVYGATAEARMEFEVWREGQRIATTTPELPAAEPSGRIVWIGSLPARSLPPGSYELVARVTQAGQQAEERTRFEIRESAARVESAPEPPAADRPR